MRFIKGLFTFVFTLFGILLVAVGYSENDYVLMAIGLVFLIPLLRKIFGKKNKSSSVKKVKKKKPRKKAQVAKPGLLKKAFGSYTIESALDAYVSNNDIKVKDFTEDEYQKLLGTDSKILRKETYLFPLTYVMQLTYACTYTGMAGVFDLQGWNRDMDRHNNAYEENKRLTERYEDQMMQYDNSLQKYQQAEQTRRKTIADAKDKSTAFILTSGMKKPRKPKLKLLKVPKAPQSEDDYTKFTKRKTGNLNWNNVNANFFTRKFETTVKFNNSHEPLTKDSATINALIDSYMKGYDGKLYGFNNNITNHSIKLTVDPDITPQIISLSDKELLKKEKSVKFNSCTNLEDAMIKDITSDIKNEIDAGTIQAIANDVRLKDVGVKVTKLNYKINDTKFLPVQLIEYTDKKGKNEIEVLDFISKKIIKI